MNEELRGVSRQSSGPALRQVTPDEREARRVHRGAVIWLTGLSGAGKSTLALALERVLFDRHLQVTVLDGDVVRSGLSADLGYSYDDRVENIRRVAEVAALFADAGSIVVTAFISPYEQGRQQARARLAAINPSLPFVEVHVDAPLAVCEARDPKGLYARARTGDLARFTGVSDRYEPPASPELRVRTDQHSVDVCVDVVVAHLLPLIVLK